MKALSLCSGIGGLDRAAEWAGITPCAFVEIEPFCQSILRRHWPDVPIWPDMHTLDADALEQIGARDAAIIYGGIPCQPFSDAGQRRGADDPRNLWPDARRIISIVRPKWVVLENVAGFVRRMLPVVVPDLEDQGYHVTPVLVPASAVGAPHQRKRVFIIGRLVNAIYVMD